MTIIDGFLQPWENINEEFDQAKNHLSEYPVLLWGKGTASGKNSKFIFVRNMEKNWNKIYGILILEGFNPEMESYSLNKNIFLRGDYKGEKCMPDDWLDNGGRYNNYFVVKELIDLRSLNINIETEKQNNFKNPCLIKMITDFNIT